MSLRLAVIKSGFPLIRLATGTEKLSRGHAQYDIFAFSRNIFLSVCFREKVELSSEKPNDNQLDWLIFANAAFLFF